MRTTRLFNAHTVREALLKRGAPYQSGFVRYAYRPFDTRWLYWEEDSGPARPGRALSISRTCSRGICGFQRYLA